MCEPKLIRNPLGYYEYSPKPSPEFLEDFYNKQYYQQTQNVQYAHSYSSEYLEYLDVCNTLRLMHLQKLLPSSLPHTIVDVGAGEGFQLKTFINTGWKSLGLDYSSFGLQKHNPQMLEYFIQGNIYNALEKFQQEGKKFSAIALTNVLEHVISPDDLLALLMQILDDAGILIITVPNDFSDEQAACSHFTPNEQWWLCYPDHLTYFNYESMKNFLESKQLKLLSTLADYPIEFELFAEKSNYVLDRKLGPVAHAKRVSITNHIYNKNPEALETILSSLGSAGIGRNLTFYVSKI